MNRVREVKLTSRAPLFLSLAAGLSLALAGCSGQQAACAAPAVEVTQKRVAPGESFEVNGVAFATGCEDVIVNGEPVEDSGPQRDIAIKLRQGSRTWDLATVNARQDSSLSAEVRMPLQAAKGGATVIAGGAKTPLRVSGS